MFPLTPGRHVTRTKTVPLSLLRPARTPSLPGTDSRCSPATAHGSPVHQNNGLTESVQAPSSCPHRPSLEPAPDSDEHGPALDARTGQHFFPDWDGPTVPSLRLRPPRPTRTEASSNQYKLRAHVPSVLHPAPDSDKHGLALAARTSTHFLLDWMDLRCPAFAQIGQGPQGTSTSSELMPHCPSTGT
jgi:hypothetical protein